MEIKQIDIKMPKMDYQVITVTVKEDGVPVQLGENDKMYMTVRDRVHAENFEFQKSTSDGIKYNSETQKYEITITSKDTKNMDMEKRYGYDITVYFDGNKPKQKIVGKFTLTEKYTLNEVV